MRVSTTSTRLRDRTLQLVLALPRSVTFKDVSDTTGLPAPWLTAFARGEIEDPSVNRIECLWEYLTGTTLEVDPK